MDGLKFDSWSRRLATGAPSRRELLRLIAGSGVAALGLGGMAERAHACFPNRARCARGTKTERNQNCCSGTCKKGKCRPTKGAAGCTVEMDLCREGAIVQACPNGTPGFCVVRNNGKPLCVKQWDCEADACTSNADCDAHPGGLCITSCPSCGDQYGNRACVYPA